MLGSYIAIPVGQVLAGPLSLALGLKWSLIICAGVLGLSVIGMAASRSVRTLEHHPTRATPDPAPVPVG